MIDSIRIGKFDLYHRLNHEGKTILWIGLADDGEGGEFDEKLVEEVIGRFYDEHF